MNHGTHDMENCITECGECHDVCLRTVAHCLEKRGQHAEAGHVRILLDCAQVCHTSADFMIRGSDIHALICGVCAEVCVRCAESCERMAEDELDRRCAEICRRCAESCRRMAGAMASTATGAAH